MDWTSLYLVLEEKEGKWILKAIAHGEWTP
jgi:hypothetical protein